MSQPTPKPPPSKPPCKIHPSAIISEKAHLSGTYQIEIHEGAIIQPHARLRAETGPITIGRNSTVAERTIIGTSSDDDDDDDDYGKVEGENGVRIGENVCIEGSAVVSSDTVIGDFCVVEAKAVLGRGVVLGRYVKVTALGRVGDGEKVDDFVVVFGDGRRRVDESVRSHREVREAKRVGHEKMMELLGRLIPNGAAKWAG